MKNTDRLNPLAEKIISLLVFEESFEHILSDLPDVSRYAVGDELKTLIVSDYVKPCREIGSHAGSGMHYDSDKLSDFSFRLSAKGLSYLERNLKNT